MSIWKTGNPLNGLQIIEVLLYFQIEHVILNCIIKLYKDCMQFVNLIWCNCLLCEILQTRGWGLRPLQVFRYKMSQAHAWGRWRKKKQQGQQTVRLNLTLFSQIKHKTKQFWTVMLLYWGHGNKFHHWHPKFLSLQWPIFTPSCLAILFTEMLMVITFTGDKCFGLVT